MDDTISSTAGPAGSIQAIDKGAVHRICSGQVVLSLAVAVKELVENGVDAGATVVDVRLKEYGSELVEVVDNGCGVEAANFEGLTLKHHTSKLRDFTDLCGVETFGFRGEALSSLCSLSKLSIITCHKDSQVGTKLEYDHNGKLLSQTPISRQTGTTVTLCNLFSTLPVRHKEFLRNLKKEFVKMVNLLTAYCVISTGVKITCTNQLGKGKKSVVVSTGGNKTIKENITNVFGAKQVQSLLMFEQAPPTTEVSEEFGLKTEIEHNTQFKLDGYISTVEHGCGRSSTERQFYYVNSRPCDYPKVSRVINEVYHMHNRHQYPFIVLNITMEKETVDVNVTPDKRQIFVQEERVLLATIKSSLLKLFEPKASVYKINQVSTFSKESSLSSMFGRTLTDGSPNRPFSMQKSSSCPSSNSKPSLTSTLANMKRSFSSAFTRNSSDDVTEEHTPKQRKIDAFIISQKNEIEKDHIKERNENHSQNQNEVQSSQNADSEDQSETLSQDTGLGDLESSPSDTFSDVKIIFEEYPTLTGSQLSDCRDDDSEIFSDTCTDTPKLKSEVKVCEKCTRERMKKRFGFQSNKMVNGPSSKTDDEVTETVCCCSEITDSNIISNSKIPVRTSGVKEQDSDILVVEHFSPEVSKSRRIRSEIDTVSSIGNDTKDVIELERSSAEFESDNGISSTDDDHVEITRIEFDEKESLKKEEISVSFSMRKLASNMKTMNIKSLQDKAQFRSFRATITPGDNNSAEEELKREIRKEMFQKMTILGQFNLGFIIVLLGRDLFIVDQHASDEKYNFEMLQRNTVLQSQKLVIPQKLDLTAANETMLVDGLEIFTKNGFEFLIDEDAPPTQRVKLVAKPVSKSWEFGREDIEELIFMLSDSPGIMCRPSRVRQMFASRACRKSVMIGTALNKQEMKKLVQHMGEIEQPWNCPHGRPTMRHLINLDMLPD